MTVKTILIKRELENNIPKELDHQHIRDFYNAVKKVKNSLDLQGIIDAITALEDQIKINRSGSSTPTAKQRLKTDPDKDISEAELKDAAASDLVEVYEYGDTLDNPLHKVEKLLRDHERDLQTKCAPCLRPNKSPQTKLLNALTELCRERGIALDGSEAKDKEMGSIKRR